MYHYSKAITYTTEPPSSIPITSKLFMDVCLSLSFKPEHAHVIMYPNEKNSIDWHNDNPIKIGSSVLALRLGCPRIISLRKPTFVENVVEFTIYEGDVWIMNWNAQNEWDHAVLPITKQRISELLQNHPRPVFAINTYTSGAIVGRIPCIGKKPHNFSGNEQLLVPNANLKQIFKYKFPKSNSKQGPPFIHFSMAPYFGAIELPIGSIHTREFLFNEQYHTNQQSTLVSNDNICSSLIFGEQDIFNDCIRLWDSNNNINYEIAMQNAGLLSSTIRVFVNLQKCKHTIDISSTKILKKLTWGRTSKDLDFTNNPQCMMYVGMMFTTSFTYKASCMYFQVAEKPAPKSWRELVFNSNNYCT